MTDLSRRRFLRSGAATAAALTLPACATHKGSRRGRDGKLRFAVVGVRVQGSRHLATLLADPAVSVVAVCDVDTTLLLRAARMAGRHGAKLRMYRDVRKLLEDPSIDAVTVATPDHWHAWITTAACAAGKDVYVESPVSHGILESRAIVAAARKNGRRVQAALPARAHSGVREAIRFVHDGGLGEIRVVRAICYRHRPPIGKVHGEGFVPAQVDFDLWTGPAPKLPLSRAWLHGDWRWDWHTGNGEIGETGTPLFDLALWALGPWLCGNGPDRIWTCGGRIGFDDDGQTPNTFLVGFDFGGLPLIFEQRNLPQRLKRGRRMDRQRGVHVGLLLQGAGRFLVIDSNPLRCVVFDDAGNVLRRFDGRGDPLANFVSALRERQPLRAEVAVGCAASDLTHLANIAHRTGATAATRVEVLRTLMADEELLRSFDGMDHHLSLNGYDLALERPNLSGWQALDATTGEFLDHREANALRRRQYRKPFELIGQYDTNSTRPQ